MTTIRRTKPHPKSYGTDLPLGPLVQCTRSVSGTWHYRVRKSLYTITPDERAALDARPLRFIAQEVSADA